MTTQEKNYLALAQKIAENFRYLIEFDTIEHCKASETMEQCRQIFDSTEIPDFLIAVGVALSFNLSDVPPDQLEADDISDDYLDKHPEERKKLEAIVKGIEALKRPEDDADAEA